MPTPDWNSSPDWDVAYLGGVRLPGVARVEVKLPSGLDVKKAKGGKRASVKDLGTPAAEVEIALELFADEMEEFESEVVPMLRPRSATEPHEPLALAHPNARLWGVHTVKIGSVTSPMPSTGGTFVVRIQAVEHVKTPPQVKKAKDETKGDWDVQKRIDALKELPSQSGAPAANFSALPPASNGVEDGYTPVDALESRG